MAIDGPLGLIDGPLGLMAVDWSTVMIDRKHWQSALDSQSACNLSGLVFSFNEAMEALCAEAHELGEGTEWKNKHPICVLFITQLAFLSGVADDHITLAYHKAYEACKKGAKQDG